MANTQLTAQLIRVKRKIIEDSLVIPNKKCKFVGSCSDLADDNFKQFLKNLKLDNKELDCDKIDNCNDNFKIVDYGNYDELLSNVPIGHQSNFPQIKERICCNGVEMTKVKNENIDYVYDIFIYENDNEDYAIDEIRDEIGDEEVSSNDEDYAYNDYPDDEEVDDNEYDFYRQWEDDDEIEIRKRFEGYKLSPDYGSEEEDDYHLKYHMPNDSDLDENHES